VAPVISCHGKKHKGEPKAKYIFLFIGDGMGNSHVAATESYLSYKAGKLGGEQLRFTQFPYLGLASTYSANASITCSSAAGTAIACGAKTNNGMVGMDPEGNHLKSMAYELKEDGYKIGIMSSVPINHATPSSFYAHNKKRSAHYELSQEIPASGFDFFGGDGFLDAKGKDGKAEATDVYLEKNGYEVCYGLEEYKAAKSNEKVIFCQLSNRDAEVEQYTTGETAEEDASLAEIVETAIDFLGDKKPFFIMCEGGEIDWAGHSNLTMPMIDAVIKFDDAIAVAYEFYKQHPEETLIVVTADHETGGISLGQGESWSNTFIDWAKIEENWEKEKGNCYKDAKANREFNEAAHIGWTTSYHTGGAVPVYSIGKGAEKFAGRIDNAEIKGKILEIVK
jgi:alkaline phosphatase